MGWGAFGKHSQIMIAGYLCHYKERSKTPGKETNVGPTREYHFGAGNECPGPGK